MSNAKLGALVGPDQERDAVHVAIVPVIAAERLWAGQHIGLDSRGEASCHATKIGIVDPFLLEDVRPGERFQMVLYPDTVTGMRHHWSHPAFSGPPVATSLQPEVRPVVQPVQPEVPSDIQVSVNFIDWIATEAGMTYAELMEAADNFIRTGDYLCEGGRWEGFGVGDDFWEHYEKVTGRKVPEDDRGSIFTCSC